MKFGLREDSFLGLSSAVIPVPLAYGFSVIEGILKVLFLCGCADGVEMVGGSRSGGGVGKKMYQWRS